MKEPVFYRFDGNARCRLKDIATNGTAPFSGKEEALPLLERNVAALAEEQAKLFAQREYALLIVLQGLDAAGKDGAVRHVFSGLNPQGVHVRSFKQPSAEELSHDYLWRAHTAMPARGEVGIFNRSYYEDVIVVRVNNLVGNSNLPAALREDIWNKRFTQIRHFESYLAQNAVIPIKCYLHLSKEEQRKRLLARLDDPKKNWKFTAADVDARASWDQYQTCIEDAVNHTAAPEAPWYIIPADKKWYARYLISEITLRTLRSLHLHIPAIGGKQHEVLENYRRLLDEPGK